MIINDSIYGSFNLTPLLEELINTKAVQRLKHIHQGGSSYLVNPNWNVTRYEHSIGVMLLISIMDGSIKEQIAGLLHDISHTAFSHVIHFALDNKNENYHEEIINLINSINPDVKVIENKNSYDIHKVNKLRLVDPFIFTDNILCRASDKSTNIKILNERALEKSLEGAHIKILT